MKTPIAIIGIGCRFPGGADNHEALFKLACTETDAIRPVPDDRWDPGLYFNENPQAPGKAYVMSGGFLKEPPFDFDALFFGVSPREAEVIDPQQRLLLEVAYEAIEDAGLQLNKLKNSRTGVFIGGFTLDNMLEQLNSLNLELADAYTPASLTMTMLSNRLSYAFGLQGPSMTIDTACSSSLVATHLGCQSIWSGESDIALVGGVNLMLRPEFFVVLSKGRFLSTHGRCRSFDEQAGGYARAEGAGIAILKPLSTALQDGDRILAVIRNTGVNQDGTTAGISSPNQAAQETLLRRVLHEAGIPPAAIHYVEAHGTGTQAGDLAESQALHNVLSEGRDPDDKCVVGSIKSNIGHAESAAGIAGMCKAVNVLARGIIPPNLHFTTPNPKIPFSEMCIRVPTHLETWPKHDKQPLACVSSFGYGGTNAAVVLEAPPRPACTDGSNNPEPSPSTPLLIPLSARSPAALQQLAARHANYLEAHPDISWADYAHSLCYRRSHLKHRVTLLAADVREFRQGLDGVSRGEMPPSSSSGITNDDSPLPLTFIFTGMGPQYAGMGMDLFRGEKVFQETMHRCEAVFKKISGISILDELTRDRQTTDIGDTRVAQPANFFIQAGLFHVLDSWGIRPDVVVGHSVGEIAAAYASGALSLEDALLVTHHRSRLQQTLSGSGALMAVELHEDEAVSLLRDFPDVSIAAVNGPSSLTLAGEVKQLTDINSRVEKMEKFSKVMDVSIPYHSRKMDAIESELLSGLEELAPREGIVPLYSTVTGKRISGTKLDGQYWWRNVREPVRFADAVWSIVADTTDSNFLEVGPHPVLRASLIQCLKKTAAAGKPFQTLNRKTDGTATIRQSVGTLHCHGYVPRWNQLNTTEGRFINLPGYPWQKENYAIRRSAGAREYLIGSGGHPFLRRRVDSASLIWQTELTHDLFAYIRDHRVSGQVVVPGAAYLEAGLAVHKAHKASEACLLENVEFHRMLSLDPDGMCRMSVTLDPDGKRFEIHSRLPGDTSTWVRHASGTILHGETETDRVRRDALETTCSEELAIADFYRKLEAMGLVYGPAFQTVTQLRVDASYRKVLAKIENKPPRENGYLLHPTVIDGAFQSLVLLGECASASGDPMVPVSLDRFCFHKCPEGPVHAYSELVNMDVDNLKADIVLFDEDGVVAARIDGIHCRRIASRDASRGNRNNWLHEVSWDRLERSDFPPRVEIEDERWLILADQTASRHVIGEFTRRGIRHVSVIQGNQTRLDLDPPQLERRDTEGMQELVHILAESGITHVLNLWAFDPKSDEQMEAGIADGILPLRNLAVALGQTFEQQPVTVVTATCGARIVTPGDHGANLAAAPISAFGRVVENEFPKIACKHFDFTNEADFRTWGISLLLADSREREIAVRGGSCFIQRVRRSSSTISPQARDTRRCKCAEVNVVLLPRPTGSHDSICFREAKRVEPEQGEIEVRVLSTSMKAGKEATSVPIFSGTVTAVGDGVDHVDIGDEVVGIGGIPGSFYLGTASTIMKKPDRIGHNASAGLGSLLGAYYVLTDVIRLKENEKVLVNHCTGPLGRAFVEVAGWIGAQVFAAASVKDATDGLIPEGCRCIYTPTNLALYNQVMTDTDGHGLDAVINLDPEETFTECIGLLAFNGRLVEIGKRDAVEKTFLPKLAFRKNLAFSSVDFESLRREKPLRCLELLVDLCGILGRGIIRPPAFDTIPAGNIAEALTRTGPQHRDVVVSFKDEEVEALQSGTDPLFRTDGTYLVTGGTKGFGLEVAKWIARNGAGEILLISRGGADESTLDAISEMLEIGVSVTTMSVDVGNESEVRGLAEHIRKSMPPLRGVFHAAVVLDDALLANLNADSLSRSLHAKVGGLVLLDTFTREFPVEIFVCFSSVSALIGNTGQAAYVVANAFLDEFAHYRRSGGLPCTSVNFGAIADVGILKRNEKVEEMFQRYGINSMKPADVFKKLEQVIRADVAQAGIIDVSWETLGKNLSGLKSLPAFEELVQDGAQTGSVSDDKLDELRDKLSDLNEDDRTKWLHDHISQIVSEVMRIPVPELDINERFGNIGIDSLSAAELGSDLKDSLGIEIPIINLLNLSSVSRLATHVSEQLQKH